MEDIKPDELFKQIRAAHRMVVAYYKRLFPVLSQVASELDMQFYRWQSINFNQPAQKSSDVFKKWEWDLVPALNTSYLFYNAENANTQKKGDWLIEFRVLTDTGVLDEDGYKNRKGNQDPLDLSLIVEDAESILEVYIFCPSKEGSLSWYKGVWWNSEYPAITNQPEKECVNEDHGIYANAFSLPLTECVDDDIVGKLVQKIELYRDKLFS